MTVIAVLAALLAVWYARATILIAGEAREDAATAHAEQMVQQAEQLLGSTKAQEQEMFSRARQLYESRDGGSEAGLDSEAARFTVRFGRGGPSPRTGDDPRGR